MRSSRWRNGAAVDDIVIQATIIPNATLQSFLSADFVCTCYQAPSVGERERQAQYLALSRPVDATSSPRASSAGREVGGVARLRCFAWRGMRRRAEFQSRAGIYVYLTCVCPRLGCSSFVPPARIVKSSTSPTTSRGKAPYVQVRLYSCIYLHLPCPRPSTKSTRSSHPSPL